MIAHNGCKFVNAQQCLNSKSVDKKRKFTASLDRIDSKLGYELNNIQWVHKDINMMKQAYTNNYFIEHCKLVAANNITSSTSNGAYPLNGLSTPTSTREMPTEVNL